MNRTGTSHGLPAVSGTVFCLGQIHAVRPALSVIGEVLALLHFVIYLALLLGEPGHCPRLPCGADHLSEACKHQLASTTATF